jgi:divinyl chlorophyllide a 8-vinyl-reductase
VLPASETTVLITATTGYIVRELLRQSHRVLAMARHRSGIRNSSKDVAANLAPARMSSPTSLADLSSHGAVLRQ